MQGASFLKDFGTYKPWTMLALAATTMNLCTKAEDTFFVEYSNGYEGLQGQETYDACLCSDGGFGIVGGI